MTKSTINSAPGDTADFWPVKAEGNLAPPAGGTGTGSPPHWSAKICKKKITIERVGTWANAVPDANTPTSLKRPAPDNTCQFKATIDPLTEPGKIRFFLVETSKETGTNMNTGNGTELDLTFENQTGFTNPGGEKQEIVETDAEGSDRVATVAVTAHDYGPRGTIKAKIEGTEVESEAIRVIKDDTPDGGNWIEDAWDDAFPAPTGSTLAANEDNDNLPAPANTTPGDSLSRYEEYRGFTIGGQYSTTNPKNMDVFYYDVDVGQPGDFITDNIKLTVHALLAGEYATYNHEGKTFTKINPNRGFASAGLQGVIRVTKNNNLDSPGESKYSTSPPGVNTLHVPASNYQTAINVDWFSRSITTSAALTATTLIIPVNANTNTTHPDDSNLDWQNGGKIKVDDEVMNIVEFIASPRAVNLWHSVRVGDDFILIDTGGPWPTSGWGTLSGPDENITWSGVSMNDNSTTLTQAVDNQPTSTTLHVASVGGFRLDPHPYIRVDSEIMRITGYSDVNRTFTVVRNELGTAIAGHANGSAVTQRSVLTGVQRHQGGTDEAAHGPNATLTVPRAFLVQRPAGVAHANGKTINYFYTTDQRDAAIRMIFAHECGHGCFMGEAGSGSIMQSPISPGAIDGTGIYHTYSDFSRGWCVIAGAKKRTEREPMLPVEPYSTEARPGPGGSHAQVRSVDGYRPAP